MENIKIKSRFLFVRLERCSNKPFFSIRLLLLAKPASQSKFTLSKYKIGIIKKRKISGHNLCEAKKTRSHLTTPRLIVSQDAMDFHLIDTIYEYNRLAIKNEEVGIETTTTTKCWRGEKEKHGVTSARAYNRKDSNELRLKWESVS